MVRYLAFILLEIYFGYLDCMSGSFLIESFLGIIENVLAVSLSPWEM